MSRAERWLVAGTSLVALLAVLACVALIGGVRPWRAEDRGSPVRSSSPAAGIARDGAGFRADGSESSSPSTAGDRPSARAGHVGLRDGWSLVIGVAQPAECSEPVTSPILATLLGVAGRIAIQAAADAESGSFALAVESPGPGLRVEETETNKEVKMRKLNESI